MIKQALSDETFKASLLLTPKQAIATSTGVKLPDDLDVRVYEDTSTVKHLVLPTNPADGELNDVELETIAGGRSEIPLINNVVDNPLRKLNKFPTRGKEVKFGCTY